MSLIVAPTGDSSRAASLRRDELLRQWLPLAFVFGVAVALRHLLMANTDVSCAITMAEKVLDGQRLYVDITETNPPASILLYLPAVALARTLGWAPEFVVDLMVFVAALASLGVTAVIAYRYELIGATEGPAVAAVALAILIVLPAQTFGERDHIALIAALPMLATLAVRGKGARPRLWHCLIAGVGAAVTLCIKPHFALAFGLAAVAIALYLRSWRVLLAVENWVAAIVAVVYGICLAVFYRAYFTEMMPLVADLYLPVRLPLVKILTALPVLLWAGTILAVLGLRHRSPFNSLFLVLPPASAGFAAAYVIQGKGWPYQSYPMLALALIALELAVVLSVHTAERADAGRDVKSASGVFALGVVAVASFLWFNIGFDASTVAAAVARVAPPNPSIIAITDDSAVGHPLVRAVKGRWISRFSNLWITRNAALRRASGGLDAAARQRLSADVQRERQRLIREIGDDKPDIVLIDGRPGRIVVNEHPASWSEWVKADPDLSVLIAAHYREVDSIDGIAILKHNGS